MARIVFLRMLLVGVVGVLVGSVQLTMAQPPVDFVPSDAEAKLNVIAGAAPAPDASRPRAISTPKRLRAVLAEPTNIDFFEAPLSDAVAFLSDFHQIEIQFDKRALREAGVETSSPVTGTLRTSSLGSALRLLLDDLQLDYLIREEFLLITTQAVAARTQETRVYDLQQCITPSATADEIARLLNVFVPPLPMQAVASAEYPASPPGGMGGGMGGGMDPEPLLPAAAPPAVRWAVFRNALVVQATQREHEQLEHLFQQLCQTLPKMHPDPPVDRRR